LKTISADTERTDKNAETYKKYPSRETVPLKMAKIVLVNEKKESGDSGQDFLIEELKPSKVWTW
jgi:hypothetical protein